MSSHIVQLSGGGTVVTLTSTTTGAGADYALEPSLQGWNHPGQIFSSLSFTLTPSGSTMTGGAASGYDYGAFLLFINGGAPSAQVNYGQYDTAQSLAFNLSAQLTCGNGGLVQGQADGPTVYLVSCTTGSSTTYSLNASLTGYAYEGHEPPSFAVAASGPTMTPVTSAITISSYPGYTNINATSATFYGSEQAGQAGSFQVQVWAGSVGSGSPVLFANVGWGSSSTSNSLAASLAASFPACSAAGAVVSALVSGPMVTLVSCTGATYTISAGLNSYYGGSGTSPSFTVLTNGSTPSSPSFSITAGIADSGTVSLTLNGTQIASASYGANSTPASIASALASAGSSNGLITLQANGNNLTMTAIDDGTGTDFSYAFTSTYNSSLYTQPSFEASSASGSLVGGEGAPLYNWAISSYAPDGDVLAMTDSVMGTWTYAYDGMNRLTSGSASGGVDAGLTFGWTYDRYGNRWAQNATGTGNASAVQPQLTFYGNTNRIDGWSYDAAGNLLYDQINHYTYDAENRIATLNGAPAYIYDAEGRRVAKLTSGVATSIYVLGLGGEQVSELNGSGGWKHSNVFAGGGRLLASYEGPAGTASAGYHFHLTDWLGTKRMQTTASGNQEEVCYSYPFGDGLTCTGPSADATEHHFTGKERDTESGLDYFFARYFTSDLARFMTPDWAAAPTAVPYATFGNPQSLNLYAYVGNNPNTGIDLDGHVDGFENNLGSNGEGAESFSDPPDQSGTHKSGNPQAPPTPAGDTAQQQSSNSASNGTSFWHGVSNLFHLHSWNYVKTSVTDNETYTIAGILAPGASGAAQAAKAAAQGRPTPSAPPTLRPVPGPDPVPPQLPPGEIPEIEPGASLGQRIGVAILNLVKGFGQNVEAMPVVCFTCGDSDAERKARGLPPLD